MNRKYAFLTAGFLTGLVVVALFSFSQTNDARALICTCTCYRN